MTIYERVGQSSLEKPFLLVQVKFERLPINKMQNNS